MREIFSAFLFANVSLDYTVGSGAQKGVGEVVILDGKDIRRHRNLPLFS
nr:hypothetical protein [Marinicella sp. W31]MDC2877793.1 hypothetical protein [Marinicella sp. W31]